MGLETKTTAVFSHGTFDGKLHVDSRKLEFVSPQMKWSIALGEGLTVNSREGRVAVSRGCERALFHLGPEAGKWAGKILAPPSRTQKLGIQPNSKIWLSAGFDREFRAELKRLPAGLTHKPEAARLALLMLTHRKHLARIDQLVKQLPIGTRFWVVWPKADRDIGQADVIQAARTLGMGPGKAAAFDDRLSAMRFSKKT